MNNDVVTQVFNRKAIPIQIDEDLALPPIIVTKDDDGYVLEWIFDTSRLGLILDNDRNLGFWVVSKDFTASGEL